MTPWIICLCLYLAGFGLMGMLIADHHKAMSLRGFGLMLFWPVFASYALCRLVVEVAAGVRP